MCSIIRRFTPFELRHFYTEKGAERGSEPLRNSSKSPIKEASAVLVALLRCVFSVSLLGEKHPWVMLGEKHPWVMLGIKHP